MKLETDKCIIQDPTHNKMIGLAELQDGLYHLIFPVNIPAVCNVISRMNDSILWLASYSKVQYLHSLDSKIQMNKELICDCCNFAKQKRLPFHSSNSISDACFDLLHMDIWGPYRVATTNGHWYFLTILDDHSRAVCVHLMRSKYEVRWLIKGFCNMVTTRFGLQVKCIRLDNGMEFNMTYVFGQKGIVHQTSCTHTPQQNSRIERKHAWSSHFHC